MDDDCNGVPDDNIIEESYEYCLSYAARGVGVQTASRDDHGVRESLQKEEQALPELADLFAQLVEERGVSTPERYHAFIDVLRRDAGDALAALADTGRDWQLVSTSQSPSGLKVIVGQGQTLTVGERRLLPEGWQVLGAAEGLPPLPPAVLEVHRSPSPMHPAFDDFVALIAEVLEEGDAAG